MSEDAPEFPIEEFLAAEGLWLPEQRFKEICVASPKTGKTGSIAALANAGYRVILAAFDPGYDILLNSIEPHARKNLYILPFEDRRGFQGETSKITVSTLGAPTAFAKFAEFLNTGLARRAPCQGGAIVNFGPSETWKSDTFLVVDNLSAMAKAAFNRLLAQVGMNRNSRRRKDWGLAADEVDDVLIQLASSFYSYHLIVLAHWYTQGPREWEDEDRKDPEKSQYNNELREREKDLIPTKQVPISIGRQLSRGLLQHFPTVVWAEVTDNGERIFNLAPSAVRDSGVPVRPGTLPNVLPIESGQLSLFNAVTGEACVTLAELRAVWATLCANATSPTDGFYHIPVRNPMKDPYRIRTRHIRKEMETHFARLLAKLNTDGVFDKDFIRAVRDEMRNGAPFQLALENALYTDESNDEIGD